MWKTIKRSKAVFHLKSMLTEVGRQLEYFFGRFQGTRMVGIRGTCLDPVSFRRLCNCIFWDEFVSDEATVFSIRHKLHKLLFADIAPQTEAVALVPYVSGVSPDEDVLFLAEVGAVLAETSGVRSLVFAKRDVMHPHSAARVFLWDVLQPAALFISD